jgi:N-acetylmuramoyl-L-alanine amidase
MKKIYVSPSDQIHNEYGAGGTTEAIQCRKIAQALVASLVRRGFEAKTNLTANMQGRVDEGNQWGADLYVCIHTNAYNKKVSGTRLFCYSTDKQSAGYHACDSIMTALAPITPGTSDGISARPELYEIKKTNAPCVYIEVDFHDVNEVAMWIMAHTSEIAEAICKGICSFYDVSYATEVFDDVPEKAWYAEDVKWAAETGIIKGVGGNLFKPNEPCTRADVAAMLHRLYDYLK